MKVLVLSLMMVLAGCDFLSSDKGVGESTRTPGVMVVDPVMANYIIIRKDGVVVHFEESDSTLPVLNQGSKHYGSPIEVYLNGNIEGIFLREDVVLINGRGNVGHLSIIHSHLSGNISEIVIDNLDASFYDTDISNLTGIETIIKPHHTAVNNTFERAVFPLGFDISTLNTSNLTHIHCLACGIDLGRVTGFENLDISNAERLSLMFAYSTGSVDISGWNTSHVKSMRGMFGSFVGNVIGFDLLDLDNLEDAGYMFHYANLSNIPGASSLSLPSLTNTEAMYLGAIGDVNVSSLNMSLVTSIKDMFREHNGAITGIEGWDVSSVVDMSGAFADTSLNNSLMTWDTSNVTTMREMFARSNYNLGGINLWDVSNVVNFEMMFIGSNFNQDISGWDVSSSINSDNFAAGGALNPAFYPSF